MTHIMAEKLSTMPGHRSWSDIDQKLQGELLKLNMTMDSIDLYEDRQMAGPVPLPADNPPACWQPSEDGMMYRQLTTLDRLLEMCNVTFERMSHEPFRSDTRSLTQLASDIMSGFCQEQQMKDWQDATDAFEEKASALRKEGRELLRSNTRYCKAATSLKVELDEYAKRLDERADLLKKRSLRFCEIMQEWGIEASDLGLAQDELLTAQNVHATAWEDRELAATAAGQLARETIVRV
jgi:hypothetical protein